VNKCMFLGKVSHGPELVPVATRNAVPCVNFELEIEEFRKDSNGEKVRNITYLAFEAWDSAALAINKYAKTGSMMAVESVARNDSAFRDEGCGEEPLSTYFRVSSFKIIVQ